MKNFLVFLLFLAVMGVGCSAMHGQPNSEEYTEPGSAAVSMSTELDLSHRGLTAIPMDIFSRTELSKLDLSGNRLTGAPPSQIKQLKNLTELNLSNNSLTGLPAELGQLNKLEILDVSNNRLTGLPMELGNLSQLRILDISGNSYSEKDLEVIVSKLPHTEIRR